MGILRERKKKIATLTARHGLSKSWGRASQGSRTSSRTCVVREYPCEQDPQRERKYAAVCSAAANTHTQFSACMHSQHSTTRTRTSSRRKSLKTTTPVTITRATLADISVVGEKAASKKKNPNESHKASKITARKRTDKHEKSVFWCRLHICVVTELRDADATKTVLHHHNAVSSQLSHCVRFQLPIFVFG